MKEIPKSHKAFVIQKPVLGERVYISERASVTGAVTVGDDVSFWPGVVARADMHRITIGDCTNIQDNSVLHVTHQSRYNPEGYELTLGKYVTVGHSALLHGCLISDRVCIGMGTIVMDGAIVHAEVLVGAGSLVTPHQELESGYLYHGRPAKKIRALTEKERAFLTYSAENYVRLKEDYLCTH